MAARERPGSACDRLGEPLRNANTECQKQTRRYAAVSGDRQRTPDVRARPFFPEWCAEFTVSYPENKLTSRSIAALINAAGQECGIGDWRQQGVGTCGRFRVVTPQTQAAFDRIVKEQGRKAQMRAYEKPDYADQEASELMSWFEAECRRRELEEGFKQPEDIRQLDRT